MDGSGGLPPPHLNYGILQKRLAFRQEESVSVAATLKAIGPPRIPPRRLHCHRGASVVTARNAAPAWMRIEGIWAADVGVFRERRHRGRHMANPRITNAPPWVAGRSQFVNSKGRGHPAPQMDVKPFGADSRYRNPYPLLVTATPGTYDRLCSPLQSCSSMGKPLSSVPQPTRAERMQALRDAPPFSISGLSTLANSLQIPCSLLKIPC
jgi:hypothetical protein